MYSKTSIETINFNVLTFMLASPRILNFYFGIIFPRIPIYLDQCLDILSRIIQSNNFY